MAVFNRQTSQNKKLAAEYVLRFLNEANKAEIVENSDTGCGKKMLIGIKSDLYGLVHVTCTSNIDSNGTFTGWGPKELSNCDEIDHIAFVWADTKERVLIFIVKYDDVLNLSKKNNGNYSKADIKKNAVKGGSKAFKSSDKTNNK